MEHIWYCSITCEFALLAQLVARGSDKAKVIGSSPVESRHQNLSLFWPKHFFFTSPHISDKKILGSVSVVYNASCFLKTEELIRTEISTAGVRLPVNGGSGVQLLDPRTKLMWL